MRRPVVAVVVFPGSNDDRDAGWALGALGALLACAFQAAVAPNELVDPLQLQLLNAACLANTLGWLAGTLLVARLRALEWLHAQEAA